MLAVLQWVRPPDNWLQGLPEGTCGEEDKMTGEGGGRMGLGGRGEETSPDISYVLRLRRIRERNTNEELHRLDLPAAAARYDDMTHLFHAFIFAAI